MKNSQRRVTLTLGAVAGGLLAAALLPTAVASADEYDLIPDPTTFSASQAEGYPPLVDIETGTEAWGFGDMTAVTPDADFIPGTDTMTTFGSVTNNDFLTSAETFIGPGVGVVVPAGTQIDLAAFGDGFGNEWIDLPGGSGSGISDLLITPFGDYELMGSFFSEITSALGG
jgi:hypothetical protein